MLVDFSTGIASSSCQVWHQQDEPPSPQRTVLDEQVPTLRGRGGAGDSEAESCARALIAEPLELDKHALTLLAWDARSAVAHFHAYCTVLNSPDDRNGRTRGRVH